MQRLEEKDGQFFLKEDPVNPKPIGRPISVISMPRDLEYLVKIPVAQQIHMQMKSNAPPGANAYCVGREIRDENWPTLPPFYPIQFYQI